MSYHQNHGTGLKSPKIAVILLSNSDQNLRKTFEVLKIVQGPVLLAIQVGSNWLDNNLWSYDLLNTS